MERRCRKRWRSDRPQTCGLRARFPDCLSTHRFAGFNGQQSGRECIFPFRTALRFACAVFRACALRVLGTSALRAFTFLQAFASTVRNRRSASLASSLAALVAHWAHFGLFRALRAAFVRPAKNTRNDVHPTVRNRRSASLAGSLAALVAHWAYFGLFRALRATFVRPVISD